MSTTPRIIPVIDLLQGRVVHAVAGRRNEYQPIVSPWSRASDPVEIVRGIQIDCGLKEFYLADLDAIVRDRPQWDVYEGLLLTGARLMVDGGVRDLGRAEALCAAGIQRVVIALETLVDTDLPGSVVSKLGDERFVFSLDLMQGRPLAHGNWQGRKATDIVERVIDSGIRSLIVLDIATVGSSGGISTLPLCGELRRRWRELEIITGGGVRDWQDAAAAHASGADAVLVATALHSGRIGPSPTRL